MQQPKICQRKRRGRVTFYCELGGKQFGLGTDPEKAKVLFADLLARHHGREEVIAPLQPAKAASPEKPALTVQSVLLAFLEWSKKNHAEATFKFYHRGIAGEPESAKPRKGKARSFVSFHEYLAANDLAGLLVADFGPEHVEGWLKDHFAETSDNYRHNLIRSIQAAFNWAMGRKDLRRQIGEHPLIGLKKPAQTPREAYVTDAQWKTITENVKGEFLDFLTILKETGCRPQEAREVEAKHFDRTGRRWYFPKPVKKLRGKPEPRIVHLTDRAFEICQRLALKRPSGPLFVNEDSEPWKKNAINCRCKRLRDKLGFNLQVYSLRHTFCTDALKRGVDPLTVAKLMGHKNATMVMEVYNNLGECQDHLREALRKATG